MVLKLIIYILAGVVAGKLFGFNGFLDILLWPLTSLIVIWAETNNKDK